MWILHSLATAQQLKQLSKSLTRSQCLCAILFHSPFGPYRRDHQRYTIIWNYSKEELMLRWVLVPSLPHTRSWEKRLWTREPLQSPGALGEAALVLVSREGPGS